MSNWKSDKRWSDRFIIPIKKILGEIFIEESNYEDDALRNTDLMVFSINPIRIGCRIRRHSYFCNEKYRYQFTIRTSRPSGRETELSKILSGWGDYFFYGFCNESETNLEYWVLIDLTTFRKWFSGYLIKNKQIPGIAKGNFDNSSSFRVFEYEDMPVDVFKETIHTLGGHK